MKNTIVIVIVSALLIVGAVYFIGFRREESPVFQTTTIPAIDRNNVTNIAIQESPQCESSVVQTAPVSSFVQQVALPSAISKEQEQSGFRELPSSSVDRSFNIPPMMLPTQIGSNALGRSDLDHFVGMISNDLQNIGAWLRKGDFTVREWNLSKKAVINDPNSPVTWRVFFDWQNGRVDGIKKDVFTDATRRDSDRSQGYNLLFQKDGVAIDQVSRNDGSEYVMYFQNGLVRQYVRRYDNMHWYSIRWDAGGKIVSEKLEGPSPMTMSAYERYIDKYKNDPKEADRVRRLQEELSRMQSNR